MLFASLLASVLVAAPAEPHRVAIVVGANGAAPGRAALRYAHADAQAFADALVRVAHFAASDVDVLLDPKPQALTAKLDARLEQLKQQGGEGLLMFYYSGHADDGALYPAGEPLPLEELRRRLERDAATVRIGIIDACRGGNWTQAKGLTAEPPFAVQVPLNLQSEGSVLISSSSGLESAHESEALQGSFFTHHFIAGMLGAAKQTHEGTVTLAEAFAYAQEHTVRDTAVEVGTPQHPSFHINLKGRADLALASLDESPSAISLHETRGPLQLLQAQTGVALLEVPAGERTLKLAVPPGHYILRRADGTRVYVRELDVTPGAAISVDEANLTLAGVPLLAAKGDEAPLGKAWRTEFGLQTTLAGLVALQLGGSYFFSPLIDDPALPYGVLSFMEHPSTVSAAASLEVPGSPQFGATLSGAIYPWRSTGFTASVGLTSAFNNAQGIGSSFSIGVRHYLLPTLRLSAGYEGGFNSFADDATGTSTSSSNYSIGTVGVSWLVANRALLSLDGNLNYFSQTGSTFSDTYGTLRLSSTFYLGRRLSLGLAAYGTIGRSSQNPFLWQAGLSPSVEFYFTDWLIGAASYTGAYRYGWGALPDGLEHVVTAKLGVRF
jgi:hypothetical protein